MMKKKTFMMKFFFLLRLQEDPPTGVSGAPTDNNIMIWNAVIFGLVNKLILLFLYSIYFNAYFFNNYK